MKKVYFSLICVFSISFGASLEPNNVNGVIMDKTATTTNEYLRRILNNDINMTSEYIFLSSNKADFNSSQLNKESAPIRIDLNKFKAESEAKSPRERKKERMQERRKGDD